MHDTRVGRFFAEDPLFKSFPWNSSYTFSENRVIDGVELEGLEVIGIFEILKAKLIPAKQKPLLVQIHDGAILATANTAEGILWTVQNPKKALKGTGNFLLMIAANGISGGNPIQGHLNMFHLDNVFGTSTQATAAAFETSINDGYEKLINGSAQDKSEIISGVLLAAISERGVSYVVRVGKLTLLARLPKGGKLIKYIAGEHKYIYHVDDTGRIVRAKTDNFKFKTHDGRLVHDPNTPGKLPGDHAGHLFADLFGGDPTLKNLVSQASKVNQSVFRKIEKIWEKALQQGKTVEVDIKVNYDGNSTRPSSFEVTYKIDGEVFTPEPIINKNP